MGNAHFFWSNMELKDIKGIGKSKLEKLSEIGIKDLESLLNHYPKTYENHSKYIDLKIMGNKDIGTICGTIVQKLEKRNSKFKSVLNVKISVDEFIVEIVFFNSNYIKSDLEFGKQYLFYGKIERSGSIYKMAQPKILSNTNLGIFPIYDLPLGIHQGDFIKFIKFTIENGINKIIDPIDSEIINKHSMYEYVDALKSIHFPKDSKDYKKAKERLIYNEFYSHLKNMKDLKSKDIREGISIIVKEDDLSKITEKLPFLLTKSQLKSVYEIIEDLKSNNQMIRLLQGDVGSGKTAVAFIASLLVIKNGYQATLMVPTEVLANQHYENFIKMNFEANAALITSSSKNKKALFKSVKSGEVNFLIGTHALLNEGLEFNNLGLVITDEQHRFGVKQRETLSNKGNNVNTLVMSATPIPRTLSMIFLGDLNMSIINELPAGRQKIDTHVIGQKDMERIYKITENEIINGRQAYIVYPLIEESELIDAKALEKELEVVLKRFSKYRVAYAHGNMKKDEIDQIMISFKEGKYDLLLSTTIIEVGIDNKNATIMIVENAERFGLSQLHQLRGRVGRGQYKSYCFLVSNSKGKTIERLKVIENNTDGFEISRKDLELRGPGDFFGTRQHGEIKFKLADLNKNNDILTAVIQDMAQFNDISNKNAIVL
jgi:ATP-dependent DNA helicase RecG